MTLEGQLVGANGHRKDDSTKLSGEQNQEMQKNLEEFAGVF